MKSDYKCIPIALVIRLQLLKYQNYTQQQLIITFDLKRLGRIVFLIATSHIASLSEQPNARRKRKMLGHTCVPGSQ